MREVMHWAIDAALLLLGGFGLLELAVFVGAAFITRMNFDFDDGCDW